MPGNKRPRKAHRPRQASNLSPWIAIAGASKLPAADVARCAQAMWTAFDNLKRGHEPATQIDILADVLNLSESLADLGICSDAVSREFIQWAQLSLVDITQRLHDTGSHAMRAREVKILDEAFQRYAIQLQYVSGSEYQRAIELTASRLKAAALGQLPGVKTLRAVSPERDNKTGGT